MNAACEVRDRRMHKSIRNGLGLAILVALTLAIGVGDYMLGKDFSLWVLYVIPIALAASIAGLTGGLLFSLLAGAMLLYVGGQEGNPFPSLACLYFQVGSNVVAYLVIGSLVSVVRKYLSGGRGLAAPGPNEPTSA